MIDRSTVHRVAVLALDGVVMLDVAIPAQVFGYDEETPYQVVLCATTPGPVGTTAGVDLVATGGLDEVLGSDTVVVPGYAGIDVEPTAPVLAALRAVHARGGRLMSICTGAFALAAAGVLDGRRATTHWQHAAELAARYPKVDVDPAVLFVDEGSILTSAGVAAGFDLCLHVVAQDCGARTAATIARRTVVAPHREGGQAQYLDVPLPERGASLSATREWARQHLREPLAVADLARHAHVSERTLARRWVAETGTSPARWLLLGRLARARELLEASTSSGQPSIAEIARQAGLGTADNLRLHFRRELRTTPTAYRAAFRADRSW